jgi:membrane protein implicated in regulation of membrane protease activity
VQNDWLLALSPVIGLAGNVIAQILCAHLLKKIGLSILAGAAVGLAVTIAALLLSAEAGGPLLHAAAVWIVALVTYLALAFGYWAFVNLNITSLRIRMLREILRSESGISQTELMAHYSSEEFLRRRLERLRNAGQLSFNDERWRLESRNLLLLTRTLEGIRTVLLPAWAQRRDG